MGIRCFLLTPTDRAARFLRRYLSADVSGVRLCEPEGYHSAAVRIEDGPLITNERGHHSVDQMDWPFDDPRWPMRCQHCGYEFHDREVRQLFFLPIYLTPDGQEVTTHANPPAGIIAAPPGAMWSADWLAPLGKGPDGKCLMVRTPGGDWYIDGPANNGPGWNREGIPPNITVNPSILQGDRYHGWLRNGELVEC